MAKSNTKCSSTSTNSELVEACHTWTIQNISFLLKDAKKYGSSAFKSSEENKSSWRCFIKQVDGSIKFGLQFTGDTIYSLPDQRLTAEFKFSLRGPKGELALAGPDFRIFDPKSLYHYANSTISKSKLLEHATDPGDTLTIICRISELLSKESPADNFPISPGKIQHDLETMLKDPQFADVTLVVEDRNIQAHKAILAARSPVFAAMFSVDMVEKRQNKVTITDMEYEVAQQMLQFIYTDKIEIDSKMADRLLAAADKYGLNRLKEICEQTVSKSIAVPTAIKTLIFADRMNAGHLKSHTMKFVKANMDRVMESDDWKTMVVEHPTLMLEVCRTLANK